jgi:diguanylate cyclase (GGDEF)-like protein/PAS domain S-box-containing protein
LEDEVNFVKQFIDSSILNVLFLDDDRKIVHINKNAGKILGISRKNFIGKTVFDFVTRNFTKVPLNIDALCKGTGEPVIACRKERCFKIKCFPLKIRKRLGFLLLLDDITEEKEEFENVVYESQLVNSIIEFIPDIFFAINTEGRVIVWNKACEKFLGVKKTDIIGKGNHEYAIPFYGKRRPILIDMALEGRKLSVESYEQLNQEGDAFTGITTVGGFKGEKKVLWGKAARFYDKEGNVLGAMEIVRDITKMREKEEILKKLAERDALTNAYNRRMLYTLLKREIDRMKRTEKPITVIYIDVDNLRDINDTYGHKIGDYVLTEMTKTLFESLRKTDIVARIGGDEFIVVMPEMDKNKAEKVIDRIRMALIKKGKHLPFKMDFSFGMFQITPAELRSMEEIISSADKEMYKMKRQKKRVRES